MPTGEVRSDGLHKTIEGLKGHVELLTGSRPPTCPWRAFYDPLVDAVVGAATLARENMGHLYSDDEPAILVDGLRVYLAARNGTEAHDGKSERAQREAEAKARRSQRG